MNERYMRCFPSISEEEWLRLHKKRVCVLGCGGLGGYVLEYLVRLGVGEITAVDGDQFDASNLNRQLLSGEDTLGKSKAAAAKARAALINSAVAVTAVEAYFTQDNGLRLLAGHDLVIDALDNMKSRRLLGRMCDKLQIPLVHGAIRGWAAQVAVVPPKSGMMERMYPQDHAPADKSSLPFTPAFCAALEAAEAVKLLIGRESPLEGKLLLADLDGMDFNIVTL